MRCVQFFSSFQMLVIIGKVLLALLPRSVVNACVFALFGWQRHANWSGKRLRCEYALEPFAVASGSFNRGSFDVGLGVHGSSRRGFFCPGRMDGGRGK
jgi:hypothetical protein